MSSPAIEAIAVGIGLLAVGVLGIHACSAARASAVYPEARDAICEAGEQLPDSEEKDKLRKLCKAEASVRACGDAFEAAAELEDQDR